MIAQTGTDALPITSYSREKMEREMKAVREAREGRRKRLATNDRAFSGLPSNLLYLRGKERLVLRNVSVPPRLWDIHPTAPIRDATFASDHGARQTW